MELGAAVSGIRSGDRVRVDLATGTVENLTNGEVYKAQPLPGFIREIAAKGGLIPYVKELQS